MSDQTRVSHPIYNLLPTEIAGFDSRAQLALDRHWSWNHAADGVWRELDPILWEITHTPWVVLQTLLISRGVPMLLGGDEFRRTQGGNNNAYCQDNETSWHDWSYLEQHKANFRFTSGMIAFSRAHPILSKERFYTDAEIHWFSQQGGLPNWSHCAANPKASMKSIFSGFCWARSTTVMPVAFALPSLVAPKLELLNVSTMSMPRAQSVGEFVSIRLSSVIRQCGTEDGCSFVVKIGASPNSALRKFVRNLFSRFYKLQHSAFAIISSYQDALIFSLHR